ncbi:integrase core domain-containing protein [Commensalibacter nepenthis]|uniref:Integrase core domain-containing protein n=1 Tax=Commensalibacter nepenthis TaxID=3043872 RepID=A0ABT6Q8Y1_9PROT|nr:integrase core domain-containing protein [Commensalibacter sp. TBRC 10068]MDI2113264.1 integrase core domain-containing protein [Commensalibacter sp. TBRC 10068]
MTMHRKTKLTLYHREEIWRLYHQEKAMVTDLAKRFMVSRPTIYVVLRRARLQLFVPMSSTNERYKVIKYGIKRLAKIEKTLEDKLRRQAKKYNKSYPGEMVHVDTKRLPLLKNETKQQTREYLFVGIDDFSRELYAGIYNDKSQFSAAQFLQDDVLVQCPYMIECVYSDNGREYQGTLEHLFVKSCYTNRINQKFTKPACPQTNGKAERVIRTLMEMWHERALFVNAQDRKLKLKRFIHYYNTVKPHKGIQGKTPYEVLDGYFKQNL